MTMVPLHDGFLSHGRFRYGWLALVLVALVAAGFWYRDRLDPATVGLATEYGLGGLAFAVMLWLAWFGIRKRRFARGAGLLKGWLSAHVYLGLALLVLVPLHAGPRLEPDLHGLAYLVVLATVVTGFIGLLLYVRYPRRVAANRNGLTFDDMIRRLAEIDIELRELAPRLSEEANTAVRRAEAAVRPGGSLLLLAARPPNPCRRATRALGRIADDSDAHRRATALLESKAAMLDRVQRDLQLRSRLHAWLLLHIPLSLAALALVFAHGLAMLLFGLGSV